MATKPPTEAALLADQLVESNKRSEDQARDAEEDDTETDALHALTTPGSQDGSGSNSKNKIMKNKNPNIPQSKLTGYFNIH
jgi:hypothetical protein